MKDSEQNDGLTLFTAAGVSCGTVTHTLSHSPSATGLFSPLNNGYKWSTSDSLLASSYTVTVQATEDGCGTTLSDTYTVNVECACTLTSSIAAETSFTYIVD